MAGGRRARALKAVQREGVPREWATQALARRSRAPPLRAIYSRSCGAADPTRRRRGLTCANAFVTYFMYTCNILVCFVKLHCMYRHRNNQ